MNKAMLLPKPRTFSGIEQVNILVNIANYQHENTWLSAENKNLRKQLEQLEEAFDTQASVHDTLNQDYVAVRDTNKELQAEMTALLAENKRLATDKYNFLNNITKYRCALEYYANSDYYKHVPLIKKAQVLIDNGEFARYVLDGGQQ